MNEHGRYVVVVTWGVRPNMPYAVVPAKESAEKLKEKAIELKYRNPRVMTEAEFQKVRNKRVAIR